jgi:hypothetical protein
MLTGTLKRNYVDSNIKNKNKKPPPYTKFQVCLHHGTHPSYQSQINNKHPKLHLYSQVFHTHKYFHLLSKSLQYYIPIPAYHPLINPESELLYQAANTDVTSLHQGRTNLFSRLSFSLFSSHTFEIELKSRPLRDF